MDGDSTFTLVDVVSDHRALLMNYLCTMTERPVKKPKYRKWKLRDADWESFQQELSNEVWCENRNVNECNKEITDKIKGIASEKIGMTNPNNRNKNKPWFTKEIKDERKERKRLNVEQRRVYQEFEIGNVSENDWKEAYGKYDKQQKFVKRMIKRIRGVNEKRIVESMRARGEEGSKNWHRFLRGERITEFSIDELHVNNETIRNEERMKEAIVKFWEEIGGMNETIEHHDINLGLPSVDMSDMDIRISKEEIEVYLRKLKNEKACGPDRIPYEMYKNGGSMIVDKLYELFGMIWDEEKVPDDWNVCSVNLLHKGGHKSKRELKNYRPIALGNTIGKIFSEIMNERIYRNEQSDWRRTKWF